MTRPFPFVFADARWVKNPGSPLAAFRALVMSSSPRGEKKRAAVPKFGSFRPKPADEPASEPPRTREESRGEEQRKRPRHSSREQSLSLSHRRRDGDDGQKSLAKDDSSGNDIFFVDKRGDPLIFRYGGNERSRVPSYRRFGRGKVLGSTGWLDIHPAGSRDQFRIRGHHEGRSAFHDKSKILAGSARAQPKRIIKRASEDAVPLVAEDFIHLGSRRRRKRGDYERRSPAGDDEATGDSNLSSSGSESDSDSSGHDGSTFYVTPAKRKSIDLSKKVEGHAEDSSSWLELIDLQDELFRENEEDDHVRTKEEEKGLANLKLSLYEKALAHAPNSDFRERLLLGFMREASRVWVPQRLAKRWIEVTGELPQSFALWRARANFDLTNLTTFSSESARQLFIERLRYLMDGLEGAADADKGAIAEQAIYVFLRLTCFLHESGFADLATGAWQALLEATFARPALEDGGRDAIVSFLTDFWDSEVPRIGEPGARGWKSFAEGRSDETGPPEAKPFTPVRRLQVQGAYEAWAAAEENCAAQARMPARVLDEGTDHDPYRMVAFSDIELFLPVFPTDLLGDIKRPLLNAWLLFCGLPPAFPSGRILESALDDSFVCGRSKDLITTPKPTSGQVEITEEITRESPLFKQDEAHMAISPDVLYPHSWFSYLASWPDSYQGSRKPVERSLILHTTRHLVGPLGIEELAEYSLALEWLDKPAGARKVAKAMLNQYQSNFRLYNAYALLEWGNGRQDVARKVLASATSLPSVGLSCTLLFLLLFFLFFFPNLKGFCTWMLTCFVKRKLVRQFLWNSWAWIDLESCDREAALSRLCSSVDESGIQLAQKGTTAPTLLKTRSHLSSRRDYLLSSGDLEDALEYSISLTLFDYLHSGTGIGVGSQIQGDIMAAIERVRGFSNELASRDLEKSLVHEAFLQFAARLLYFHASNG